MAEEKPIEAPPAEEKPVEAPPEAPVEEKPVRRALVEVLDLDGDRVEVVAHRYKEALTRWSESTMVDLAGKVWANRLRVRSQAPWIQQATARYTNTMKELTGGSRGA